MNKISKNIATLGVAGVLALSLAACGGNTDFTDTRDMGADSTGTATATADAGTTTQPSVSPEPVVTSTPDAETENYWNIPVEDIHIESDVDGVFGEGEGALAARDGLRGLSALVAQDPVLWTVHTEADEQNALLGWQSVLSPEAYAEVEKDFAGSANTIGADRDGELFTHEGVSYGIPADSDTTVQWTATTGVAVTVTDDDRVALRFDATSDVPTAPEALTAVYEFNIIVIPSEDGWVIDDVQYEVPSVTTAGGDVLVGE